MRVFKSTNSMGIVLREGVSLVIARIPYASDYSDYQTRVRHFRFFGRMFAIATWNPEDPS